MESLLGRTVSSSLYPSCHISPFIPLDTYTATPCASYLSRQLRHVRYHLEIYGYSPETNQSTANMPPSTLILSPRNFISTNIHTYKPQANPIHYVFLLHYPSSTTRIPLGSLIVINDALTNYTLDRTPEEAANTENWSW